MKAQILTQPGWSGAWRPAFLARTQKSVLQGWWTALEWVAVSTPPELGQKSLALFFFSKLWKCNIQTELCTNHLSSVYMLANSVDTPQTKSETTAPPTSTLSQRWVESDLVHPWCYLQHSLNLWGCPFFTVGHMPRPSLILGTSWYSVELLPWVYIRGAQLGLWVALASGIKDCWMSELLWWLF